MSADIKRLKTQLKFGAVQISDELNSMEIQWRRLKSIVNASRSYWEGSACTEHLDRFRDCSENIETLLLSMKSCSEHILKCSGTDTPDYEKPAALPSDLIR